MILDDIHHVNPELPFSYHSRFPIAIHQPSLTTSRTGFHYIRCAEIDFHHGMGIQFSLSHRLNAAFTKAVRLFDQVGCRFPERTVSWQ